MHRQFLTEIATQIFKGTFIICILAYLLRPIHHHFACQLYSSAEHLI